MWGLIIFIIGLVSMAIAIYPTLNSMEYEDLIDDGEPDEQRTEGTDSRD